MFRLPEWGLERNNAIMKKRFLAGVVASVTVLTAVMSGCSKIDDNSRKLSDYSDYVTLGEYKGLEIEVEPADVTEEQMEEARKEVIDALTTKEELKEGTVKDKDEINLDFTGYLDGKVFEDGSTDGKGYDYTIGGGFIEDLNDQLIGLEVGKEYDLECTFPKDYGKEELNGKDVIFKVKVNCIYGKDIVPEYNDALVKQYTDGDYTTVKAYEKYIKEKIYEQNVANQKSAYEAALWSTIIDNCERNGYPEEKLENFYNEYYSYYKDYYSYVASMYGMEYEAFLKANNMTDAKVQENCMTSAKGELEYIMVANAIAKAEKISISDKEMESLESSIVEEQSYADIEEFESEYAGYAENYLYETFIFDEVCKFVEKENTMVITDKVDDKDDDKDESEKETTTESSEKETTTESSEKETDK